MSPKTPISDEQLEQLETAVREQYRDRVDEKGTTPEGLFWDSKESMQTRFSVATETIDLKGANVLDVGCGFGDLYGYLQQNGHTPDTYHGIDVSEVVLEEARDRYGDIENVSFERRNILRTPYDAEEFDIATVFGAMWNSLEFIDNESYIRLFMRTCFDCADTVLINAISQYRQGDWSYEEFVYYYDPKMVFGYAQELTRNVRLRHDFEPIPQKEFFLVLESDGSDDNNPSIANPDAE
jgi:SAM-dependent methyltransferase